MIKPLIGVTAFCYNNSYGYPYQGLSDGYIQSLINAQATPMIIPVGLYATDVKAWLPRLDGIVFSGGGDVDPRRYGSPMHPRVTEVDEQRDQLEISLLLEAIERGIPFLGICRGLQVINVALGGSLYGDIAEQYRNQITHNCFPDLPRHHLSHSVSIESNTLLADILDTRIIQVNSMHHQAVRQSAAGVAISAHAPDGVIEALEIPEHPFGLAVQWHPECLADDNTSERLFRAFSLAAAGYREACQ